jgi:anti-sigma B factor antagonist
MNFAITSEQLPEGNWLIALTGEVDLYTAPQFKEELVAATTSGAPRVVVDMTETTFIDSTTLGVLVGGLRRLRPEGGELLLVISDRKIRKIFEITGLDRVFPILESQSEALEAPVGATPLDSA